LTQCKTILQLSFPPPKALLLLPTRR
jgi:hypothetical protein